VRLTERKENLWHLQRAKTHLIGHRKKACRDYREKVRDNRTLKDQNAGSEGATQSKGVQVGTICVAKKGEKHISLGKWRSGDVVESRQLQTRKKKAVLKRGGEARNKP